jgi:hypothetical protein
MSNPSTPPRSKDARSGSTLSKTTPLKRDLSGSQAHSSTCTSQQKASAQYKEMTVDTCEKFVGPMPMRVFLSDFVPKAPEKRPMNEFVFSHSSVSQKEDEFVSLHLKHDSTLTLILDSCCRGIWPLSQSQINQHHL